MRLVHPVIPVATRSIISATGGGEASTGSILGSEPIFRRPRILRIDTIALGSGPGWLRVTVLRRSLQMRSTHLSIRRLRTLISSTALARSLMTIIVFADRRSFGP